jgi:hypothetical protein
MIRKFIITMALLGAGSHLALAQPATDAAPKGDNPPNGKPPFPTAEQQTKIMADTQLFMALTPEKQKAYMRDLNQNLLRGTLNRAGFKDTKLQDDILEFVDEQETSRAAVRKAAAKVYLAIEPQGVPTDAAGLEALLNDYLITVEDAKAQRDVATKALETKLGLETNPRLRAVLLLHGIIGDASSLTGDIILTGTMGVGGLYSEIGKRP